MVVEFLAEDACQQLDCISGSRIYRFYGKYDFCYGQYLSIICTAVCGSQGGWYYSCMGTDYGNGNGVRDPRGGCGGSAGDGSWESISTGISENEYGSRLCTDCSLRKIRSSFIGNFVFKNFRWKKIFFDE